MQQIVEDVGKDVKKFMEDFTKTYIIVLVQTKCQNIMSDAVNSLTPSAFGESLNSGDDSTIVDQKSDDQVADSPSIAAGVALIGNRIAYGPDQAYHRYYDFACWNIKATDSVIKKVVRRHKPILDWVGTLKRNIPDVPDTAFPKKKMFGKNDDYYNNRSLGIKNYFQVMSPVQAVSTHDYFLKFWDLKYDADAANLRQVFFSALQTTCQNANVDWNYALWRAQEIGLDMDETEMLKIAAVEIVGYQATEKIRVQIESSPLPGPLKNRGINSASAKVAAMIGGTVETAWDAAKETFNKLATELSQVLDKALAPIQELINKALDPVSSIVKDKFDKLDSKLDVDDGLDRDIKASRFPPLVEALKGIANGKAVEAVAKLIESINKLNECHKYVGYIRYNLGDPEIGQYIPFLNDIQDLHYRITISLCDIAYVLGRAGVNSFEPLLKYLDKVTENGYDEKTHATEIADAVREGGRRLAIDYFSLPQSVSRACWYCGSSTEQLCLQVGQTTVLALGDLLGSTATTWKPTSKEDARSTFIQAVQGPLDAFISDRVKLWVTVVRQATANVIARQFMNSIGTAIDDVANKLNELCSAIPSPIGDNLKAGDVVKYLLEKLANNTLSFGVKMLAKKTEAIMYSQDGEAEIVDEALVQRLRWPPRIRNYDEDNMTPEKPIEKAQQ